MSTTQEEQVSQFDLETTPGQGGIGEAAGAYWDKVKAGDLGSLPAILGIVVLVIVFGVLQPDSFLTAQNFANLLNQGAAIMVLAMGLVFVLLLGEIDLSAGFAAGMGAAILGVTLTTHGWNWILSVIAVLLTGMVIGFSMGLLVARLGIPSFVVSLAYFLGLQGAMLLIIGEGGTIPIRNEQVLAVMNKNMPVALGAVVLVATFLLNQERQRANAPITIQGVPWVVPLVLALVVVLSFLLVRTSFGRHIYAVGGKADAAR